MNKSENFLLLGLVLILVAGCSLSPSDRGRVDYKQPNKKTVTVDSLKIPPELTKSKTQNRYSIPSKDGSNLSDYKADINAQAEGAQQSILPKVPNVTVRRDGIFRWLEIDLPAEEVWETVKQFWLEEGFIIASEDPESGILETDWAENRAKIGGGIITDALSKFAPLLVTSPERDKYRTRLERLSNEKTEVFLSHEGMALVASTADYEIDPRLAKAKWQYRARDPNLESEMLSRMVSAFGFSFESSEIEKILVEEDTGSGVGPEIIELKENEGDYFLILSLSFEQSWRKIGLILDSLDFSIEDKSREEGIFYIKYNDPDSRIKPKGLARLAFWRDRGHIVMPYRIRLAGSENSETTELRVLNSEGEQLSDDTALKILRVIREQLI
jgi:outer membrane protein assembly factor BamC